VNASFPHADLAAKGNQGYDFQGGAALRPNAAGNSAYRPSTMQPRSNNAQASPSGLISGLLHDFLNTPPGSLPGAQRLEAHLNTGKRPAVGRLRLDDSPLDALGGSRASSSVANEVRASALHETAMRTAGKDKMDRATVEQAIDPRTRMVSEFQGVFRIEDHVPDDKIHREKPME